MKRTNALVLLLAVDVTLMSARTTALTVAGFSGTTCRSWTQARANDQAAAMEYWALGFLSGINYGRSDVGGKDILRGRDIDSLYTWVDSYCDSRPHETFAVAVAQLAIALLKAQ